MSSQNQPVSSIDKFKGIVNTEDAIRAADGDHGILIQARNVIIDNSWMVSTPDLLGNMTKFFSSSNIVGVPPITHGGSTLTAINNVIYFTDAFSDVAEHPEYSFLPFDSNIRMMISVEDGLWVSDVDNIYFLNGLDMQSVTRSKMADYSIIPGSVIELHGNDMRAELEMTGKAVLALTSQGICLMSRGSNFRNLTRGRYNIPPGINKVTASFDRYNTTNLYTINIT